VPGWPRYCAGEHSRPVPCLREWPVLVPVIGVLLNLAADVTNLALALTIRRDATQGHRTTTCHTRTAEPVIPVELGKAADHRANGNRHIA
jgi:hypothetical protein